MKKLIAAALFAVMVSGTAVAFANLDDTRQSIVDQYGEYRMVIDTDNQLWPKAEWEQRGYVKAHASSYMHSFTRHDLGIQMEVMYVNEKPQTPVQVQRFTPNMPIKIKDLKRYFPEVYQLVTSPKAEAFATYEDISRQFQQERSPVTMGVVIKSFPASAVHKGCYTLLVFNIQDEGRLIKDPKFIDENTYIREFTIERISRTRVNDAIDSRQWNTINNYFK